MPWCESTLRAQIPWKHGCLDCETSVRYLHVVSFNSLQSSRLDTFDIGLHIRPKGIRCWFVLIEALVLVVVPLCLKWKPVGTVGNKGGRFYEKTLQGMNKIIWKTRPWKPNHKHFLFQDAVVIAHFIAKRTLNTSLRLNEKLAHSLFWKDVLCGELVDPRIFSPIDGRALLKYLEKRDLVYDTQSKSPPSRLALPSFQAREISPLKDGIMSSKILMS